MKNFKFKMEKFILSLNKMDSSLFMNKECHYAFRCLRSQLILQPVVIYGPGSKKINKLYFVGVYIVNLTLLYP